MSAGVQKASEIVKNRKKKAQLPRRTRLPIAPTETGEKRNHYFSAIRELLRDRKTTFILSGIGFLTSLAIQVSWIHTKCSAEPFIGSQLGVCKDNVVRIVFGGPIGTLTVLLFTAWLKKIIPGISHKKAISLFLLLLPISALPLIPGGTGRDTLLALSIATTLLFLIYLLKDYLWRILLASFAKPSFNIKIYDSGGITKVVLQGVLHASENRWVFDLLIATLTANHPKGNNVEVDIQGLSGYGENYAHIFHLIAAWGGYHQASLTLTGPVKNRKLVETSMHINFL